MGDFLNNQERIYLVLRKEPHIKSFMPYRAYHNQDKATAFIALKAEEYKRRFGTDYLGNHWCYIVISDQNTIDVRNKSSDEILVAFHIISLNYLLGDTNVLQ